MTVLERLPFKRYNPIPIREATICEAILKAVMYIFASKP